MKRFTDFYLAFNFLKNHEMCKCKPYIDGKIVTRSVNYFTDCLNIEVVKVNPENLTIEDNESLNTKTQVWLEFGEAFLDTNITRKVIFTHDYDLDCGADTFEEAIIELANLVDKFYYDNGKKKEEE